MSISDTLFGRSKLNFPITVPEAIVLLLLFVPLMGIHLTYTPWLFASHPINELEYYELDNEPAPAKARSFAINHGNAIYYEDGVPAEHPAKRNLILGIALTLWLGLLVTGFRAYRRSRARQ